MLDTNIFFPVKEVPLSELTGMADNGLKAIVREDTNTILATPSTRYRLFKNEDIFEQVEQAIGKSPVLDTNGMIINDSLSYGGGQTQRIYRFPEHKIAVGVNDITELQLKIVNSYDGSTNLKAITGGLRLVCTNGMVAMSGADSFATRHTGILDTDELRHRIAAGMKAFKESGENWIRWQNQPMTDTNFFDLIGRMTDSKRTIEELMVCWHAEHPVLGRNAWAGFNALTFWATHHPVSARSGGNSAAIINRREDDIRRILPHLNRLAA